MKRPRPRLPPEELERAGTLLTTVDVASLLRVHPKHVYRLLRRGLPAHRVGGEWRFRSDDVVRWFGARGSARPPDGAPRRSAEIPRQSPPPLLAANGDIAVECLLARLKDLDGPVIGFVQSDRDGGLELLRRGQVVAAGCHGGEIPTTLEDHRLAFITLVDRQVGLVVRRGFKIATLRSVTGHRFASRPSTAGVRMHFDEELRRHGLDPVAVHGGAALLPSHREVVCAVARGEADVGLGTAAWADRVGLECMPLYRETYGVLVRANLLGDPRVVALCEVVQSAAFRNEIGRVPGYQARSTGAISYVKDETPLEGPCGA
jgi:excisionase family DNA binding protein